MGGSRIVRAFVAMALAVSVLTAGEAVAKKKAKLIAKVSGKRFKANLPHSVQAEVTSSGVLLTGSSHQGLRNGSTKVLNVICGGFALTSATLPATVDCGGTYTVAANKGFSVTTKGWAGGSGLQVTFKSFDGTTVAGTFEAGSWAAGDTNPTDPPATFAHGKFSAPVISGGS